MVEQKEQEEFVMSDLQRTTYNNIVMNSEVLWGSENPHTFLIWSGTHTFAVAFTNVCRGVHKILLCLPDLYLIGLQISLLT